MRLAASAIRLAALGLVVASLAGCAMGRGWTATHTALELGFAGELAADTYQTVEHVVPECRELNPIVGRCGERVPIGVYAPLAMVLHLAVAWALPPRARDVFQAFTAGVEGAAVATNWRTPHR